MTPEFDERLGLFEELVRTWAARVDLVAPSDLQRLRQRHTEDSLRALDLVDAAPGGPCVDVGSGAGWPGVVLAIAHPDRHWRLLEPRSKRAAFLDEAVRRLGLDCEVLRLSAQAAAGDPALRRAHSVATARALAPPIRAFRLLDPLVAAGGIAVVWLGRRTEMPSQAEEWVQGLAIMRPSAGG